MPNHCTNTLEFSGKRSQCFDFARDHYRVPEDWDSFSPTTGPPQGSTKKKKTILDFSLCAPYPKTLSERQKYAESSNTGWHPYHVANWGTKWNAYDVYPETFPQVIEGITEDFKNDTASGEYQFTTAWSPPMSWLFRASDAYPDIVFTLKYQEEGCDFCGYTSVQAGVVLAEDERTCSEFAPDGVDYDDETQAEAAWEAQSENIATFFEELSL
jgi:hypothetical protein